MGNSKSRCLLILTEVDVKPKKKQVDTWPLPVFCPVSF